MDLAEKIKKSAMKNCIMSVFPRTMNNIFWDEELTAYASNLIKCGIKPMLKELGFTEDELKLLEPQFKNANNVIGMGADEFSQRCARGQILTGGEPNLNDYFIGTAKGSTGYAMPENLVKCEIDKLESIIAVDTKLCPVMNLDIVKSDNKYGLVYLIHEMIHVLASSDYIHPLRQKIARDFDEGFTEFFARLAALYCLDCSDKDVKEKYTKTMGWPTLYSNFFEKDYKIDDYCLNAISVNKTKELAKKYFLNH